MGELQLVGLATILVLGIGAQWLAWKFRLPSILILLVFGIIAGPLTGFLDPDRLFGSLLIPIVSFSVAIILFEGGLSLHRSELKKIGQLVTNLASVGALVSWALTTLAARYLLDLDSSIALLVGAILVVTGPTVIIPMLRQVRPTGQLGAILKWEGIVIDPIGVALAVLVFEAIVAEPSASITALTFIGITKTVLTGLAAGILAAGVLVALMKRYLIPDFLQSPVTLMIVITAFTISNFVHDEAGLLTVTLMGVILANQKITTVKHIVEFKENLRVLLISSLFIVLSARLQVEDLSYFGWKGVSFVLALIFIVRPASVFLSTIGSHLNFRKKLFLSFVAPRGIVAASISSVFAFELGIKGVPGAEQIVPIVFMVIIATVTFYGLLAAPLARVLGLAKPEASGALILGAHAWGRQLGRVLKEQGCKVILVDSNHENVLAARKLGLATYHHNILDHDTESSIELSGVGCLLAVTPNNEVNTLAGLHLVEEFGRVGVYKLASGATETVVRAAGASPTQIRTLFGESVTFRALSTWFTQGASIEVAEIGEEFDFDAFVARQQQSVLPLFVVDEKQTLKIFTTDLEPALLPGEKMIYLSYAAHSEDLFE